MSELRYYLPDNMTHYQEVVLSKMSARLRSYGWTDKYIREWWQTPDKNLNGFCPLEALCADKFDLVHMSLDKTVRLFESKLKQIEESQKKIKEILKS